MSALAVVDVGSTSTKVVRLLPGPDGRLRVAARAEAPTTVEEPARDVMVGVDEALSAAGAADDPLIATSSAGGGLQMVVTGLVGALTGASAQRAALGAGAAVMGVIAGDDGRDALERIALLRELRPDIILVSGGTDDGNPSQSLALCEMVAAARVQSRLGRPVPVIYAGNARAQELVRRVLEPVCPVVCVDNLRPTLERENLAPVRDAVHRVFLEHVMAHAPGYEGLLARTGRRMEPTPAAVGRVMRVLAEHYRVNILGCDVGGATTDVFSVIDGQYTRTVSANLGMSYSLPNVVRQAGLPAIARWLPEPVREDELRNALLNKMVQPTTLPDEPGDLALEQAVAREVLRAAFAHHRTLAVGLRGVRRQAGFETLFTEARTGEPLIRPGNVEVVIGSGGVLAHAPHPAQALLMLLDGFELGGYFRCYLDGGYLLPQLGAVGAVQPEAMEPILFRDCLKPLATCIVPFGRRTWPGSLGTVRLRRAGGTVEAELRPGRVTRLPLPPGERAQMEVLPRAGVDVGRGPGQPLRDEVAGALLGLVLDGRGRDPLAEPSPERCAEWLAALQAERPAAASA
jgi:uncharacterized protein (TIGR01319 family)